MGPVSGTDGASEPRRLEGAKGAAIGASATGLARAPVRRTPAVGREDHGVIRTRLEGL